MIRRSWKDTILRILFRNLNPRFVDWFFACLLFGVLFLLYTGAIAKYTSRPYVITGSSWKYCKMCGQEHYCNPDETNIRPERRPDSRPQIVVDDTNVWRVFGQGVYDLFGKYFDADWWRHDGKTRDVWHDTYKQEHPVPHSDQDQK